MRTSIASALLGLGASAYAAIQQNCPGGNICYSLNIPDSTASSGSGDIYMQITAPTTYSWVALGQGSQMKGSHIFVMYTSSDGKNVTVSPRTASGHSQPTYDSASQITLLAGSGVSNGQMVANIKCSNCNSWSGGTMDLTGSSTSWIYAALSGSALNSDSNSASISQHSSIYGTMSFDSSAKGGSSTNPFVTSSSSSGSSGSSGSGSSSSTLPKCASVLSSAASSATGSATGSKTSTTASTTAANANANSNPYASLYTQYNSANHPTGRPTSIPSKRDTEVACDDGSGSTSGNTVITSSGNSGSSGSNAFNQFGSDATYRRQQSILVAHGVMAALAFVILFPIGAISIRLLSFKGLVAFHAAIQVLAFVVYIIAFGMGVWLATNLDYLSEYHPVIGILLFVLLIFQPILGVLHHNNYKQYQRRTIWSHAHLWLGRVVLTLGMINGGLGFLLAGNTGSGAIAYGIVAALVWLMWVVSIVIGERRKARAGSMPPAYESTKQTETGHSHSSSNGSVQHEYYGAGPKA